MSEFYGTSTGFTTYVTARGYAAAIDPDDIEPALIVASEWIDGRYGAAFRAGGTFRTAGRAQDREWPRAGFVDGSGYPIAADEIPREIEKATYEAAYRQLVAPGSLSTDYVAAKSIKSAAVDGAVSVTYAGASSASDAQLVVPWIDQLLAPLLSWRGASTSALSGRVERV